MKINEGNEAQRSINKISKSRKNYTKDNSQRGTNRKKRYETKIRLEVQVYLQQSNIIVGNNGLWAGYISIRWTSENRVWI